MNPPRAYFILSIWAEEQSHGAAVWRGCLENATGTRFHFASLDALNELIKRAGWSDAPSAHALRVDDDQGQEATEFPISQRLRPDG